MANDRQVVIRLPPDAVTHAQRLAEKLSARPEYAAVRVTWTTVLRMAILRGLDDLESEGGLGRKK